MTGDGKSWLMMVSLSIVDGEWLIINQYIYIYTHAYK